MLTASAARKTIESGESISLSFWKKNGEIRNLKDCECTSSNFKRGTYNLRRFPSEEIITVRAVLVFSVNDNDVCL